VPQANSSYSLDGFCLSSNEEVRSRTGQPFLSDAIRGRRLSFFGHRSRADPSQDHSRAHQSCILGPPRDWRRRVGRQRQFWLRTVEDDLRPLIPTAAKARRRALDRSAWRVGGYSWRWLRLLDMLRRERERESDPRGSTLVPFGRELIPLAVNTNHPCLYLVPAPYPTVPSLIT